LIEGNRNVVFYLLPSRSRPRNADYDVIFDLV